MLLVWIRGDDRFAREPVLSQQPHRIKIGASVVLLSVSGLADDWGITLNGMEDMLDALGLPRIVPPEPQEGTPEPRYSHGEKYVSLWALESALFALGLPKALTGERELAAQINLAGLLYGHVSRKLIQDRVKELGKTIRGANRTAFPPGYVRPKKKSRK